MKNFITKDFFNKYFFEFIKNFILGGTVIGLYSLLIKFLSPEIAGHASGALPLVFTYVVIKTYLAYGFDEAIKVSFIGFRGGFFWLSYTFIVYIMLSNNQNIVFAFCMALILFIIMNYILYKSITKK